MREDVSTFPVYSANDLKMFKSVFNPYYKDRDLTSFEWPHAEACHANCFSFYTKRDPKDKSADQILSRYVFSSYLVDPNRHSFSIVVRIMTIVYKFLNCLKRKVAIRK